MEKIITIIIVFVSYFSAYGQILEGHLVDEEGKSIEYVNVGIVGTMKGVVSNDKGYFSIDVSEQKPTDSLYFQHLSFKRKSVAIKDFQNRIVLEQNQIELSAVEVSAYQPKLKTIKGKGVRVAGGVFFTPKDVQTAEGVGDIVELKKDHIVKELKMTCLKNSFEKALFRLNFYLLEDEKLTPLSKEPIYISVGQSNKKFEIKEEFSVHLPAGKIWIELVLVDLQGSENSEIKFPISFSGGWIRYETEFEKLPLGIGLSFSIKGYEKK